MDKIADRYEVKRRNYKWVILDLFRDEEIATCQKFYHANPICRLLNAEWKRQATSQEPTNA